MFAIRNPVLILAWGLPAVAVVASVLSWVAALRTPESELPEQYHWEGLQLDRDFSRAARATELRVRATLSGFGASGRCELALQVAGAAPDSLELRVAHATRPALDQQVTFTRTAAAFAAAVAAGPVPAASVSLAPAAAAGPVPAASVSLVPAVAADPASAAPLVRYASSCKPASEAHWRLELVDKANGWAVRQTVRGPLDGAALDAMGGESE